MTLSVARLHAQNFTLEWLPAEEEAWNASGGSFAIVGEFQPTGESTLKGGGFSVTASFALAEVVTARPVNVAPSVSLLMNQVYVIAGSGAIDLVGFAGFTPGPASESQQALAGYTLSNTSNALFAVAPAIDFSGTLRFTPAPNAAGSATVTVVAQDDGGTANGGVDKTTNHFTITVLPTQPNTSPVVASPIPDFAVNEDALDTLLDLRAVFQDAETPDEGLFFALRGNSNPSVVTATLNPATGVLQLHYRANQHGTAMITVRAADSYWLHAEETFVVTVNSANEAPVVTLAAAPVVLEDAGAQSRPNFATFSAGPADESGQTFLGYAVSNDNNALFTAQPAVNINGLLSFTTATNANGNATVTVIAQDNGGTANGGADKSTNTFAITVTAVNDAPSVTFATNVVVALTSAPQAWSSFATFTPGPANESSQSLVGYLVSNNNTPLFSAQPAINNIGLLTFTPATNANGSATVTVVVQDNGGTASGGVEKKTTTFNITVNQVNPGSVDTTFNPDAYGNSVFSTAVQADGKIVIGGLFHYVGGATLNNMARLNADGTLDTGFDPNLNDSVLCTTIQTDGKIVIGGNFTTVGGVARNRIARLNADGTLDASFNPNANNNVQSMVVQTDGKMLIGGSFMTVAGVTRNRIARLNADGTLDADFNPNANNLVRSVAVQTDGKILIGGSFTTVAGVTHNRIARLNADGTLDAGFNPNANNTVFNMAIQAAGEIVIGGIFTDVGGMARSRIARLNADGTLDTGFNPNLNNYVQSAAVQADGKIVIGGSFTTVGGVTCYRIARLNADGTLDTGFNSFADDEVSSVAVQADGRIVIGGWFTWVGEGRRYNIARLVNNAATQSLRVPSASRVQWLRGGASPEAQDVAFEMSTDGGANWTTLGVGIRIPGGWELAGLGLPGSGQVSARARVAGGLSNGSFGLVETLVAFSFNSLLSPVLGGMVVLGDGSFRFGFTSLSGSNFTALATTNLSLPASTWTVLGPVTEISPGQFQFTDPAPINPARRFYQIRSP